MEITFSDFEEVILLSIGTIVGFSINHLIKNNIFHYTVFWFTKLKVKFLSKDANKISSLKGTINLSVRYVNDINSIGNAMIQQYEDAQSITIYGGDFDFLPKNPILLNNLRNREKSISIATSIPLEKLIDGFSHKSKSILNNTKGLFSNIANNKKYHHIQSQPFRGSFVEYGDSSSLYVFRSLSTGAYPAIIYTISSTDNIFVGLHPLSANSLLELIKSRNIHIK